MIYLDWAATAPADPEILKQSAETALRSFGNPSSSHMTGKEAREILESAREDCAGFLGAESSSVYFTSGGTESNNLVIFSLLNKMPMKGEIIITGIEHPSVWEPVQALKKFGYSVKVVNPEKNGRINPLKIGKAISSDTKLVCVMAVNNETGAVQPLGEIGEIINARSGETGRPVHFHSDMVQVPGKTSLPDLNLCRIDSASFSGHKIGAPRGIGLLYCSKEILPLYCGGGQENNIRPGTENAPAAAALAEALKRHGSPAAPDAAAGTQLFIERLTAIDGLKILPESRLLNPESFVPNIISLSCAPVPGEVMQRILNENGFYVSTGSACSTKKVNKTRVLESMGLTPAEAFTTIRVSTGWETTAQDMSDFAAALSDIYASLRKQLF